MHYLLCTLLVLLSTTPPAPVAVEHLTDLAMTADSTAAAQQLLVPYHEEIERAAATYRLPPALVAAVIQEESRFDPWATRAEPRFVRNATVRSGAERWSLRHHGLPTTLTETLDRSRSYGLMQVMGETAREQGFDARYLATLYLPAHAIDQGARLLRRLIDRYAGDTLSAISAYNQGSARKRRGVFLNARYVYRVTIAWRAYERYFLREGARHD